MKQNLFLYILLGFILPGNVSATETAYQWADDQGHIHYGDRLPASVESREILLQRGKANRTNGISGLRPDERDRLSQVEQHQQQQQRRAHAARTRTDRLRAARRARCEDNRKMLKNSRGRDTFKTYSRYLRDNCW
jgi:uncharacterized protein with von Willebrand factor type A (vWA) domain